MWTGSLSLQDMVDMTSTRPLVRSATLNGYLGLARSLDLDGPRLMRQSGIDPADLAVPDKWIPAAAGIH